MQEVTFEEECRANGGGGENAPADLYRGNAVEAFEGLQNACGGLVNQVAEQE